MADTMTSDQTSQVTEALLRAGVECACSESYLFQPDLGVFNSLCPAHVVIPDAISNGVVMLTIPFTDQPIDTIADGAPDASEPNPSSTAPIVEVLSRPEHVAYGSDQALALLNAAAAWAAEPEAVGDSFADARNWLRDRAGLIADPESADPSDPDDGPRRAAVAQVLRDAAAAWAADPDAVGKTFADARNWLRHQADRIAAQARRTKPL